MLLWSDPAAAGAQEWRIRCNVGPIERTFAGRPWTVYSCSDGRSLAIFSEGSHPHRFVFTMVADGDRYRIAGSGSGDGERGAGEPDAGRDRRPHQGHERAVAPELLLQAVESVLRLPRDTV